MSGKTAASGATVRSSWRPKPGDGVSQARERVLTAAYDLFSRQGVRAVGIDTIIARADVAKMTFYHHFRSKDDLVLAFLERREQLWPHHWLKAEVTPRATTPATACSRFSTSLTNGSSTTTSRDAPSSTFF